MDSISERRSIRKFKSDSVDRNIMDEIMKAAILAPSAKNRQPWKYLIYTGKQKDDLVEAMQKGIDRERFGKAILPDTAAGLPDAVNTVKIMRSAPVLVVILNVRGVSPFIQLPTEQHITEMCDLLSIGASVENMILRANELGIGSLWIGNTFFAYDELVDFVGTTDQIVGAVSLGYQDEFPPARPRKKFEDVVEYR